VAKRDPKPALPGVRDHTAGEDAFERAMADVVPLAPDARDKVRIGPQGRAAQRPSRAPGSDDDAFAEAMADVVPLVPDPRGRVRRLPPGPGTAPQPAPVAEATDEVPVAFVRPGIDRRELRKLRRGAYRMADRLDLHGFTAAAAASQVARFLGQGGQDSRRCVAIVHGRGLHSKDNVSILKARVRELLTRHPAVLAFTDAPPSDGGSGAVYVLLRR
jgi:DNA-nicking Smr family endonuclease